MVTQDSSLNIHPSAPKETLWQRYPVRYLDPARIPVQLIITGNRLVIRFFVKYSPNMYNQCPGTNLTYADVCESGIRKNWSGRYPFYWLADDGFERAHARMSARVLQQTPDPNDLDLALGIPAVRVSVEFIRSDNYREMKKYPDQRVVPIRLSNGYILPAHVSSPFWRWGWGFFRNFQLEATSLNWTRSEPGRVTLQKTADRYSFEQIAAHEIGHVLGLGDAYGANYRFFYEAPGTGDYMMCHNRRVQAEELEKVFLAHLTNRMQYFPRKFSLSTLFTGMKRTIMLQFHIAPRKTKS